MDLGRIRLRLAGLRAVNAIGEQPGDDLIAAVVGDEAAGGQGLRGFAVERLGGVEEVDEGDVILFGHRAHGFRVEGEGGILFLAGGQVGGGTEVLKSDRGNQHEAGRGFAVVGLAQGVFYKSIQLGLIVRHAPGSVERFVIAEAGDDGVRLQKGQPFIRHGVEPLSVMNLVFRTERFRTGKGPLRPPGGVRAEAWGIPLVAHVAEKKL